MHSGRRLGEAIASAIKLKGTTQKALAAHFNIQPPSVTEWLQRGTVAKSHINGLIDYFSDVVGPSHWGLSVSAEDGLPLEEVAFLSSYRRLSEKDRRALWKFMETLDSK